MAIKKFFIMDVNVNGELGSRVVREFDGTIVKARTSIGDDDMPEGQYRILEDTSGVVTKSVESTPKVKVSFEATRKRPRKTPLSAAGEPSTDTPKRKRGK